MKLPTCVPKHTSLALPVLTGALCPSHLCFPLCVCSGPLPRRQACPGSLARRDQRLGALWPTATRWASPPRLRPRGSPPGGSGGPGLVSWWVLLCSCASSRFSGKRGVLRGLLRAPCPPVTQPAEGRRVGHAAEPWLKRPPAQGHRRAWRRCSGRPLLHGQVRGGSNHQVASAISINITEHERHQSLPKLTLLRWAPPVPSDGASERDFGNPAAEMRAWP